MTPTLPSDAISPPVSSEVSVWQIDPRNVWQQFRTYASENAVELHQHLNVVPIQFITPIHLSSAIDAIRADARESVMILHRHEAMLNRHEQLLEEMREIVKVIEVETRILNPDSIHEITDAAESELNGILHAIKEKRFPQVPSPEMDALLSQAIDRKLANQVPAEPSSTEGLEIR